MRRLAVLGLVSLVLGGLIGPPARAANGVTEVCRFTDSRLVEISGLAYSPSHPGVLWTHNDSGGGPYLYAIDARTCRTLARVRISGIPARDIEAIAPGRDRKGRPVLWIADIGDNRDSWPYVRIHRIREPVTIASTTVLARTYRVRYADRPHNAEALLADPHSPRVWIVTKQLAHGSLYALPTDLSTKRVNVARPIRVEGGLVTDGAVSPDGTRYVLRDYVNGTMFEGLPPGRNAREFPLPLQFQGEAITWTADGRALLVASERDSRLLRVELPTATPVGASGSASAAVVG
jgi:hypothetical protein